MDEIIRWSAVETAGRLASGALKVADVTRAHLDRVAECEPGLRAVVEPLEEAAMAQAAAMDAAPPEVKPPLWGVPVTIKINVDFEGLPNSNGLPGLNTVPCTANAPVVDNIRNAGAVVIGRTSTTGIQPALLHLEPDLWPHAEPVGSGRDLRRVFGRGLLGHRIGHGGAWSWQRSGRKLRYPAYCCGLATLRPSMGRVPAFNPSAPAERSAMLQMMSVQGVIAREVGDVRLAYDPLRQRSAADPLWSAAPDSGRSRAGRALRVRLVCRSVR